MSHSKWAYFVRQCLLHRTHGDEFRELVEFVNEKYQISGREIIQIIVECRRSFSISSDPLIAQYVRATVTSGLSQTSDVLYVLVQNWNSKEPDQGLLAEVKNPGCLSSPDALIINDLALVIASNKPPATTSDVRKSLSFTSKWLVALIGWISDDGESRYYLAILTLLEALGILFASIISTEQGMGLFGGQQDSDLKLSVVEALETALPVLNSISVPLHTRLDMIQKHFNLFRTGIARDVDDLMQNTQSLPDALQFEARISDKPNTHARASLYMYMNAALCGRPMVDDASLMGYLNVQYAGDYVSMYIDVIVAVFDVLSNGQARNEGEQEINLYRSFMMNRLPSILALISSSSLEPVPAGLCISQALGRIDLGAFPLSAYDMERRSSLAGIRQEFLFACALHRLIPEASVENLLGENPMQTLPSHGLYEKDQLVQQIVSNAQKGEQLFKEIELMEGNAGIVVTAIIEVRPIHPDASLKILTAILKVMHSQCRNKDTVPLKDWSNLVVRKPQVIDIITLFKSPGYMLGPLCSLLDNWNWDELHGEQRATLALMTSLTSVLGESQPVYEEFGAILLLVLTVINRYELTPAEIGITSTTSFVRQLMEADAAEDFLDDLDEPKRKHLGDWIAALFVADSLSDELTSSCSPRDFYRILPTLLNQSIAACACGKLSIEVLKSGFDYLLEPFLLPSLAVALRWLANHLWRTSKEVRVSLSLLQSLLKPPSSTEAREIRQTILTLIAEPLNLQLRAIGSEDPQKQVASAIADSLSPYISPRRNMSWIPESQQSSATSPRGLLVSVSQTFHRLLDWSTSLEVNASPPKFTFKLVSAAVHLHGASDVLLLFLNELKMLFGTGKSDAAVDMVASIIWAPFPNVPAATHCLCFPDALKNMRANLTKTLKKGDAVTAEIIVRLHQRVQAFAAAISHQEISMNPATSIGPDLSNMDLQNINLDAAAANAEIDVTALGVQPTSEDIDQILEGATGMENFGANAMGSGTDDVFGLEGSDIQMMNFDDMDLEGMF